MKNILKKFGLSFLALVFVLSVGIFAKTASADASPTADMGFALTIPLDNGTTNILSGGGATYSVDAYVVNGTTSVEITGNKLSTQTVVVGGTDMGLVTPAGTTTTPTYTVDSSGIAVAGGNIVFTLTVSEALMSDIVYYVNIQVAYPFSTPVDLGTAGDFTIFSNTGISSTGTTLISGDIGVGPGVTSSAITGNFALDLPAGSAFSTSALVTGKVYAYDYAAPTPAKVNTASLDLTAAYNAALDAATTVLNAGGGGLGGLTLVPGVYTFDGSGDVNIASDLHLSGDANGVWIFQIPGNLSISSATKVLLEGGAVSGNIFWAVAGTTTLGTTSTFEGNILGGPDASTIAMENGAVLHGRALGQTDVTLIGNTVIIPAASSDKTLSSIDIINPDTDTTLFSLITPSLNNTVNVSTSVTSVTITPTMSEGAEGATIKVNNVTVVSGEASDSIPLSVGNNIITITTTAPDLTTSSYVINIRRAASNSSGGGSIPSSTSHNTNTTPGCSAGNLYNTSTGALCINNAAPQGCSVGNLFNTSTGAACVNNAVVAPGCSGGNLFNTSTGAACTNNAVLQIPGCGNRTTGFSTATGGSCVGNSVNGKATYNFGSLTLKNGSKGDAVMELQRFLNDKLNLGLVIDGKLGPKTIAVIKKWQKDNGLVDDGLVGPKTKALMNSK